MKAHHAGARLSLGFVCLVLMSGCVTDRILAVEVRPPRDAAGAPAIPDDVVSWELWLERLRDGQRCGSVDDAASGRAFGEPAAMQVFDRATGMGMAFGEVPEGRWSLRALARSETCEVRLYGCSEFELREDGPTTISVDVAEQSAADTCGCRTCDLGVCTPETVCP